MPRVSRGEGYPGGWSGGRAIGIQGPAPAFASVGARLSCWPDKARSFPPSGPGPAGCWLRGSWSFFQRVLLLQGEVVEVGGDGEETWGFKKGPRQVHPADLFRSQKQVEPRLFYSILFGCPRSTSNPSNLGPVRPQHPGRSPTAAGCGQSPLPTLPSSLSQSQPPSNHRGPRFCRVVATATPGRTSIPGTAASLDGAARGHPSPGWGFPTRVATL